MTDPTPKTLTDEIRWYETQCLRHLARVELSHSLAITAAKQTHGIPTDRVIAAFGKDLDGEQLANRLCDEIHPIHLVALKTNFELFLNRVLRTVWIYHFDTLSKAAGREMVPISDLIVCGADDVKSTVADIMVPSHGLAVLTSRIGKTTGIDVHSVVGNKAMSQIKVAFEVRHLVEHRRGAIDGQFRSHIEHQWQFSTWGRQELNGLKEVDVTADDVEKTYEAMTIAVPKLSTALVNCDTTGKN